MADVEGLQLYPSLAIVLRGDDAPASETGHSTECEDAAAQTGAPPAPTLDRKRGREGGGMAALVLQGVKDQYAVNLEAAIPAECQDAAASAAPQSAQVH